MAKPGRMLTPEGVKRILNVGLESCKQAVGNNNVIGEADFSFALDGQYSIDKDGEMGIKAEVAYIDGLPVNLEPSAGKGFEAEGNGNITISFNVKMKNKEP